MPLFLPHPLHRLIEQRAAAKAHTHRNNIAKDALSRASTPSQDSMPVPIVVDRSKNYPFLSRDIKQVLGIPYTQGERLFAQEV
jgi:hypothetical protein